VNDSFLRPREPRLPDDGHRFTAHPKRLWARSLGIDYPVHEPHGNGSDTLAVSRHCTGFFITHACIVTSDRCRGSHDPPCLYRAVSYQHRPRSTLAGPGSALDRFGGRLQARTSSAQTSSPSELLRILQTMAASKPTSLGSSEIHLLRSTKSSLRGLIDSSGLFPSCPRRLAAKDCLTTLPPPRGPKAPRKTPDLSIPSLTASGILADP